MLEPIQAIDDDKNGAGCRRRQTLMTSNWASDRKLVDVVGILIRPDGDFLLTSRPPGKVYEG
jgi:hypothetical protein